MLSAKTLSAQQEFDVDNARRSIAVGISPLSNISTSIYFGSGSTTKEDYSYAYSRGKSINLGYEKQYKGMLLLSEFSYTSAEFDSYKLKGTSEFFNPEQTADISSYSITQYMGKTFNQMKRLQFPIYWGIGLSYITGGPFENVTLNAALRTRVKFYITERIAVYAGARAYYGFGTKSRGKNAESGYIITNSGTSLDAGLIIGI